MGNEGLISFCVVPVAAVRPPLWSRATREVWETEVQRRGALQESQLEHIPLVADTVENMGYTPEEAEAEAVAHACDALQMLQEVQAANAPPHVVKRFAEHHRLMCLQTADSSFREGCPLPFLILVDGAHRWHVAVQSGEQTVVVSAPPGAVPLLEMWRHRARSRERERSGDDGFGVPPPSRARQAELPRSKNREIETAPVRRGHPASELHPFWQSSASGTGSARRNCAHAASGALGAHYNYLSHVSSPMSLADRVFLLQSWYISVVDAPVDSDQRRQVKGMLFAKSVHRLLLYSISRYRNGAVTLGPRLQSEAQHGKAIAGRVRTFLPPQELRDEYCMELPPAIAAIVAPTSSNPRETLMKDEWPMVQCAMFTMSTPASRLLAGHILRSEEGKDSEAVDVDEDDAGDAGGVGGPLMPPGARTPAEHSWSFRLNSFECIHSAASLCNENLPQRAAQGEDGLARGGTHRIFGSTETALTILSSIRRVEVVDLRLAKGFHFQSERKYSRVYRNHMPSGGCLYAALSKSVYAHCGVEPR